MTAVLIMAGGKSERMRAGGVAIHKVLREVAGVTLLERNIRQSLYFGFRHILIAVSSSEIDLQEFVQTRGQEIAAKSRARIELLVEQQPRGTIGVARDALDSIADGADLIVLNGDNLSTLSFADLQQHHENVSATLTIAVHDEGFQVPLGEVVVEDGQILEYREKPIHPVLISSGAYVLSPEACRLIPPNARMDVPELIPRLRAQLEPVAAFRHQSHWIDINDEAKLEKASQLVRAHAAEFEFAIPSSTDDRLTSDDTRSVTL